MQLTVTEGHVSANDQSGADPKAAVGGFAPTQRGSFPCPLWAALGPLH